MRPILHSLSRGGRCGGPSPSCAQAGWGGRLVPKRRLPAAQPSKWRSMPLSMRVDDMECPGRAGRGKSVAVGGYCDGRCRCLARRGPWPGTTRLSALALTPGLCRVRLARLGSGRLVGAFTDNPIAEVDRRHVAWRAWAPSGGHASGSSALLTARERMSEAGLEAATPECQWRPEWPRGAMSSRRAFGTCR